MSELPAASHADRVRAGTLALVGGTAVLAIKSAAWGLTGSTAVLSDALESVVNVAAAALLLFTLRLSAQPADQNHPYGHGKIEFFSAGVEGTLIGVAALMIAVEAIGELRAGAELHSLDLGLLLVAAASVLNGSLGVYLIRLGRRSHSLALVADGQHLLADVMTSAGVLLGLAAVWITGWTVLDPLVALAMAVHILRTGWNLVRQAVGGLMDEADPDLLHAMAEALESARQPWWIDAHGLREWRSGPVQHADLHMVVPRYFDADRLHEIDEEVEAVLIEAAGRPGEAIVHFDPCRPRHCTGCTLPACDVRSHPFQAQKPLTVARTTRGDETLDTGTPLPRPGGD